MVKITQFHIFYINKLDVNFLKHFEKKKYVGGSKMGDEFKEFENAAPTLSFDAPVEIRFPELKLSSTVG